MLTISKSNSENLNQQYKKVKIGNLFFNLNETEKTASVSDNDLIYRGCFHTTLNHL